MTDSISERRSELGLYLRARRERLSPTDVGLPGSGRRRTPGLRREEIASLAGISTTWYTFLEQGRDVHPSHQVIVALSHALQLDDAERAHLLAVATDVAVPLEDVEYIAPEVAEIPRLVEPNPAYVTSRSYDLLAWNDAVAELLPGALDEASPNLVRWVFLDHHAREVLLDWEIVAQGLLARLRANAGKHPRSPRFELLVNAIRAGSVEADTWWPRYDIASPLTGVKRVRTSSGSEQLMSHASFHVSDQPDQILTIYRPV